MQQRFFVNSIGLFGSVVRDDFKASSDIDIIVDFTKTVGIEFVDLANFIESKLNKKIDLVSKNGVKKNISNKLNLKSFMYERASSLLIGDIIDSARKILDYTNNISFDEFSKDSKTIDAVIRNFEISVKLQIVCPKTLKTNTLL